MIRSLFLDTEVTVRFEEEKFKSLEIEIFVIARNNKNESLRINYLLFVKCIILSLRIIITLTRIFYLKKIPIIAKSFDHPTNFLNQKRK